MNLTFHQAKIVVLLHLMLVSATIPPGCVMSLLNVQKTKDKQNLTEIFKMFCFYKLCPSLNMFVQDSQVLDLTTLKKERV